MKKERFPQFFSIRQVAEALGVSIKTIRRKINAGELHAHRIGRQLRISEEDYRAFIALRRR